MRKNCMGLTQWHSRHALAERGLARAFDKRGGLLLLIAWLAGSLTAGAGERQAVVESARDIPIVAQADVVVVGGNGAAVAAAAAAAAHGAHVFLAASQTYLGDDMCATLRLGLEPGELATTPLAHALFDPGSPARPMHIKATLDNALLSAGVTFLFGCYATDILRDERGAPCGIVMANRAGRQAVVAKVVIDATDRGVVARLAGATFQPFPTGTQTVTWAVMGGDAVSNAAVTVSRTDPVFKGGGKARGTNAPPPRYPCFSYTLRLAMADAGVAAWCDAEQQARDLTFHPGAVDSAETFFQVPPDALKGRQTDAGPWTGIAGIKLDAFRPAGVPDLYVLGGCADVSRAVATEMLRPATFLALGERIGVAAAAEAAAMPAPRQARLSGQGPTPPARHEEDTREALVGIRPVQRGLPVVHADARELPVLAECDVVVVGGGTAGAPAAIAAARQGARTLVIEYQHGLGGVSTVGLIGKYYHGFRGGVTAEIDRGVAGIEGAVSTNAKMEWYRRELRRHGVGIWFGTIGCGALVQGGQVRGVVVATPQGRGVVRAKVVVDATGNADIAACAGALCSYIDETSVAIQGAGLPPHELGARYTNTDYLFVDETDMQDVWRAYVYARTKYPRAFDLGTLLDTRERRRIVGDFVLSPLDLLLGRTYPDTVVRCISNFDSHGFTVHPVFLLRPPGSGNLTASVPYRCLLPRGLDGILVTGLGVSAHRDAMPIIRMQPDVQNQGYAAGVAAAMAARLDGATRKIAIKTLQQHLVQLGCLPDSVLTDTDSLPLDAARVAAAVATVGSDYRGVEVVLAQSAQSLPLLRQAWAASSNDAKRIYAHVLGMLGDSTGVATLAAAVNDSTWDTGWNYRGMGQYGASQSKLDSLIMALGMTRDRRGLAPILAKAATLDAGQAFSHHRAVATALGVIGDPSAARPLAALLAKPGMHGYACAESNAATAAPSFETADALSRNNALREIVLAAALFRCGDCDDLGRKTLDAYTQDLCGVFARYASAVLQERTAPQRTAR